MPKSALDETTPKPSYPSEIGSGSTSTQSPPPIPEPIDTREIHEHVRDSTGNYHHEHDPYDTGL